MGLYAGNLTAADLAPPQQPVVIQQQGLLDKAEGFITRNTGSFVNILDAVGRLRKTAKAGEVAVNDAYFRNITLPPSVSWFERETVFPGVMSNGLVTAIGALLVGGVAMLALKPRSPR